MSKNILLNRINALVENPFDSLEACLTHYQSVLPGRVGDYHQEAVSPTSHHNEPGEADRLVRHALHLGQDTYDISSGLDGHATTSSDLECNGGFVRHGYFVLLAGEYVKTGQEIYAKTIVEHILHYIENGPPFEPEGNPSLESKKSTSRPFEAAARAAGTWPEALAKIIKSPAMTSGAWAKILLSVHEHAVFLRKEHWKTANDATFEAAAVGLIAVFYQEFAERDAWLDHAINVLDHMWPERFADDGYSREMSGSYHWVAMRSFFTFYELACNNGYEDRFPASYRERLIRNSYAELYQDKPDGSTPISNDSSSDINRREQLARIHKLFNLPEVSYFLSGATVGEEPETVSYHYPDSRVSIMRSDWGPQANYLYFDMGRWGDNHMNQDQLAIEVSAKGRHFLINGGKWRDTTADPDAEWMGLAKYFKATASCNSVLVNGYGQIYGDAEGTMNVSYKYDYADGRFNAGFGEDVPGRDEKLFRERGLSTLMENRLPGVTHRRQVFFARPHGWVVRDTIEGPGLKSAGQLWHFYEGSIAPVAGNEQAWATQFSDSNLLVLTKASGPQSAAVYEGQKEPFFAGWHCPSENVIRPAPELRFTQKGSEKLVFHTLLWPCSGPVKKIPIFDIGASSYKIVDGLTTIRIKASNDAGWRLC